MIFVVLLALGVSCSILEKAKLTEDKPSESVTQAHEWKSTTFPSGERISTSQPSGLGSAQTYGEFKKFFMLAISKSPQILDELQSSQGRSAEIDKLFRTGMGHFSMSGALSLDEGIHLDHVRGYTAHVAHKFGLVGLCRERFESQVHQAVLARTPAVQTVITMFADAKGVGQFLMVLLAYDPQTQEADYALINMLAKFDMPTNTFVNVLRSPEQFWNDIVWPFEVGWHSSPSNLSKEYLDFVLKFMKYAALEKFKDIFQ